MTIAVVKLLMYVRNIKMNSEEMVDIELDIDGKVMPAVTDKIALIDADTLAYTACLLAETQEFLLARDMYIDEEWEAIIADPNYDDENHCIWVTNLDYAYSKAMEKLQCIYDKTGCRTCEMHFTGGRENFRYTVLESYKGNRTGRAPTGLNDLKLMLMDNYPGTLATKWEADDIVVYKAKQEPEKYIMVAIDKDLLHSIPGRHFNYYESSKYNIEMKWMETDELTAMKWPYIQTLTGDKVDNIIGLPRIGPKKAEKILAGCNTELECWEAVVNAFNSHGKDMIDALVNMRLVSMHQLKTEEELELWSPKHLK